MSTFCYSKTKTTHLKNTIPGYATCQHSCNLQLKPIRRARTTSQKKVGEKRPYQSSEEWAHEQYKKHYFLPILFQNLKNYDAHLLIKQFHRKYTEHVTRDGTLTYMM